MSITLQLLRVHPCSSHAKEKILSLTLRQWIVIHFQQMHCVSMLPRCSIVVFEPPSGSMVLWLSECIWEAGVGGLRTATFLVLFVPLWTWPIWASSMLDWALSWSPLQSLGLDWTPLVCQCHVAAPWLGYHEKCLRISN